LRQVGPPRRGFSEPFAVCKRDEFLFEEFKRKKNIGRK
jgi:hypothetical protein